MPERANLLRAVLRALPVPVVLSARDNGLVLYANEPAARAFGIPLPDLIGNYTPDVYVRPEDRKRILEIIQAEGRLREHEVLLKGPGGAPFWALASSEPMPYEETPALCTTFIDVSERKAAADALHQARSFADSILATVREPLLVLDRTLHVVSANRAFYQTFGLTEADVLGMPFHELQDGEWDNPRLRELLTEIVPQHREVTDFEITHGSPHHGARVLVVNARKLYRPGNETETILLSIEDVTERRRLENALVAARSIAETEAQARARELAEAERRLANVLRNTLGVVYRCANDRQWTMEFVSEGCRALTGYESDELVGNRAVAYGDLIHPDDREAVWSAVQAAAEARRPFQIEYRIRTRDGVEKWIWEQGAAVYDGGELIAHEGVIHDVTERKKAEEERQKMELQMRAAQRMEAIGRLAGGVAHDFNNLLTVIQGYARFLRDDFRKGDPAREDAQAILNAAERAARLTAQLLAFSRKQVQELRVVDLNEIVSELDKMLRRLIGEDVELVVRLAPDLDRVKVDVTQIEQVLMNLVVNARDAMPRGGRLTVETANAELGEAYGAAKNVDVAPGSYVMLAVTDTGTGMDRETQLQIFEPFFTTKEKGKGTGLGLPTVYGIVKQSGGYIWVYSEPGRGTTFKIYLPAVSEPVTRELPAAPAASDFQGTETILLVEDEEAVRKITARILKRHGYQVLEAAHGGEALLLCERHQGPIHLMLTDVVMPEMSGRELAERLASVRADMRVIFSSGYTDHTVARHGILEEGTAFLPKPLNPEMLVRKVREMLDR